MTEQVWRFEDRLTSEAGVAPAKAEGVQFCPGQDGRAAVLDRPAVLAYPTAGFNPDAFTISLRVRHEGALNDYFFRQMVYFYHETSDLKNRIGILKRSGTNSLVFFLSNGQGRAKGENFAGDWFAMATPPLAWESGTWHNLVCTADKSQGVAQFLIDGRKVAEARGTQFPEKRGDVFWVGSEQGHSWMRGAIDELRLEPVSHLDPSPLPPATVPQIVPAAVSRLAGKSVGQLTEKELSINLDYFDICIGTDTWDLRDNDAEMARLMALCAHFGFDRILYRVSVCGAEAYHTRVMTPAFENVFEKNRGEFLDTCCANIPSVIPHMATVMRDIDPLTVCAKYAHQYGMQVYAWVTVFDSLYYAPPSEFFQMHPEYTWVSRDGTKHVPGVPCYAYPEVRKYRLDQVQELLDYDIDGIIFCPRSHSPWPGRGAGGGNEGSRGYGFNEPVVQEYQRRYGKDPRTAAPDSLDELRFVQLKADFYTQFMREARQLMSAKGKKLAMITSDSMSDPVRAEWMYIDATTLARERIVDELCFMAGAGADLNHWRLLGDGQVRVTTFAGIHGETYDKCLGQMRTQFRAMLDNPTSAGSTYQEFANLIYPDCWEEGIIDPLQDWLKKR